MKEYRKRPEVREKERQRMKEYYYKNKEKIKARAISKKILIPKNQLCERCKKNYATDKHHEDYDKPLEVEFLCEQCHINLHQLKFP